MPADEQYDTPHPTVSKVGHHPTCWNNRAPPASGRWVRDGWIDHRPVSEGGEMPCRSPRWTWIPFVMSPDCQQPGEGFDPDAGCVGCLELNT